MRRMLVLLPVLVACHPAPPGIAPMPYAAPAAPLGEAPAAVSSFHDPGLQSLGLPMLRSVALPPGYRELRLSGGHGMIAGTEYPVIRIVQTPQGVSGAILWVRCAPCRATAAQSDGGVDWARTLRRLDSLGITDLVPPSSNSVVHDAGDLVVEIRTGSAYRAYEVNAPQHHPEPQFAAARAAEQLVSELARRARP